jgi:hypothetical protein
MIACLRKPRTALLLTLGAIGAARLCIADQAVNSSETAQKYVAIMRAMQAKVPKKTEGTPQIQRPHPSRRLSGSSRLSRSSGLSRGRSGVIGIGEKPPGLKQIGESDRPSHSRSTRRSSNEPTVCKSCGGAGCPSCVPNHPSIFNPIAGGIANHPTYRAMAGKGDPQEQVSGRIEDGRYWITAMHTSSRTWTSTSGKTVDAELVKFSYDRVHLKGPNERAIRIHPLYLSDTDLEYMLHFASEQDEQIAEHQAEIKAAQARQSENGQLLAEWVWRKLRAGGKAYREAVLTGRSIVGRPIVTSRGNVYVADAGEVKWGTPDRTRIERFVFEIEYVTEGGLVRVGQGVVDVGYPPLASQATLLGVSAPGLDNALDGGLVVSRSTFDEDLGRAFDELRRGR